MEPQVYRLLSRYLAGDYNETEVRTIHQWYNTYDLLEIEMLPLEERNVRYDVLFKAIEEELRREEAQKLRMKRLLKRIGVAAAVLLFIVFGIWFLVGSNQAEDTNLLSVNNHPSSDLPSGRQGAILTLANGHEIVLDDAQNGTLTHEGNSTIRKEDGRLVYSPLTIDHAPLLYNTISTPRGSQYQLVLSDGTKVWLNAASSIRFPTVFANNERKVEVIGEAYFEVRPHPRPLSKGEASPLVVKVGDQVEVAVLGTSFNVSAYEDEAVIKTTLLEGSVKVGLLDLKNSKLKTQNSKLLSPGEQSQIGFSAHTNKVEKANVAQVVSWKNGQFYFVNTPLDDVMRQLTRWYDVEVSYEDQALKNLTFSGVVSRTGSVAEVLKMLELTKAVRFDVRNGKINVKM
jgi:ferric-dicitrate binding protein FerR (iron transport regulator)